MGWCSATRIFDAVCDGVLSDDTADKKEMLRTLINVLEDGDWDCQSESEYYDHPMVHEIMKDMHPDWFEDEEE